MVSRCLPVRLQTMVLLIEQVDELRRKPQPELNEVEVCTGVPRARGKVVWASRLRRAEMSPERMVLMQA